MSIPQTTDTTPPGDLARLFLRLGLTAYGGPAAHIAMMHDEVVTRRNWMTDQEFLDLVGATNLIPGPNSTEMAIHIGFLRGRWKGLLIAGLCFIVPAMILVLGLAIAYVEWGTTPTADRLLYGIKPIMIAVILQALWALGRKALSGPLTFVLGAGVLGLAFLGVHELILLFSAGVLAMLIVNRRHLGGAAARALAVPILGGTPPFLASRADDLTTLFLLFLKTGAILYGSGYVLLAFLRADFVDRLGWLTDEQLVDAVAIGQLTPGPVFTTATFVGYVVEGVPGALLATLAIFLPSFLFVAVSGPFIPHMRRSPWFGALLDGVNAAALGLMAYVTWLLADASIIDIPTVIALAAATLAVFKFKINTTWLILAGALFGLATDAGDFWL